MVEQDVIDVHMAYLRRAQRFTFWYGWLWGVCFGLFVALAAFFWIGP